MTHATSTDPTGDVVDDMTPALAYIAQRTTRLEVQLTQDPEDDDKHAEYAEAHAALLRLCRGFVTANTK